MRVLFSRVCGYLQGNFDTELRDGAGGWEGGIVDDPLANNFLLRNVDSSRIKVTPPVLSLCPSLSFPFSSPASFKIIRGEHTHVYVVVLTRSREPILSTGWKRTRLLLSPSLFLSPSLSLFFSCKKSCPPVSISLRVLCVYVSCYVCIRECVCICVYARDPTFEE